MGRLDLPDKWRDEDDLPPPPRALDVPAEPCPYCAVWIGPHRHRMREDGSIGLLVEAYDPDPEPLIFSLTDDDVYALEEWRGTLEAERSPETD